MRKAVTAAPLDDELQPSRYPFKALTTGAIYVVHSRPNDP